MIPYFECLGRGHCSPTRNCKWWDVVECDQQSTVVASMAGIKMFFYQSVFSLLLRWSTFLKVFFLFPISNREFL